MSQVVNHLLFHKAMIGVDSEKIDQQFISNINEQMEVGVPFKKLKYGLLLATVNAVFPFSNKLPN